MADKLQQTMMTLAEDNRDIKTSLRLMLKYEVQNLLERLSELGEESVLLLANANEGTSAKLGTGSGGGFLSALRSSFNLDLKHSFLKFCTEGNVGPGRMANSPQQNLQEEGLQQINSTMPRMQTMQSPIIPTALQQPGQYERFHPYGAATQHRETQRNLPDLPNFWNTISKSIVATRGQASTTNPGSNGSEAQHKKKRNVCRHFIGKGHCWQGARCSFFHTRDPEVLANLGINLDQVDSTQGNQTDDTQDTASSMREAASREPASPD